MIINLYWGDNLGDSVLVETEANYDDFVKYLNQYKYDTDYTHVLEEFIDLLNDKGFDTTILEAEYDIYF